MKKVIFWGIGDTFEICWNKIKQRKDIFCDEYPAFCDNNYLLWGEKLYERLIIEPDKLNECDYDYIVITSIYGNDIHKQLIEKLKVNADKIMNFDEYTRYSFSRWIYRKKYGKEKNMEKGKHNFDLSSLVIYTALTGNHDTLKTPLYTESNITYVCFTNNKQIKSNVWNMEYINAYNMDNVLLARKIKMQPHIYFREFETSIWVDGKFKIKDDLRKYVDFYGKKMPILCFPHFARECIYEEAAACIVSHKGKKEEIVRQISNYINEKFPFNSGLYETGCIVRNHHDIEIKRLMDEWYEEIKKYSYRDQLSFPKVCMKNKIVPDICDLDINSNKWLWMGRYDKV